MDSHNNTGLPLSVKSYFKKIAPSSKNKTQQTLIKVCMHKDLNSLTSSIDKAVGTFAVHRQSKTPSSFNSKHFPSTITNLFFDPARLCGNFPHSRAGSKNTMARRKNSIAPKLEIFCKASLLLKMILAIFIHHPDTERRINTAFFIEISRTKRS